MPNFREIFSSDDQETTLDFDQEKQAVLDEFSSLIAYGKPANFTLYLYSHDERLLSLTINASEEEYVESICNVALFLCLITAPRFIFVYNTFLPYMGGIETNAVVIGKYMPFKDLEVDQHPYVVEDGVFVDKCTELSPNPSVSPISDEIMVALRTVKAGHSVSKTSVLPVAIEFLKTKGIEFTTYGNNTAEKIVSILQNLNSKPEVKGVLEEIRSDGQ